MDVSSRCFAGIVGEFHPPDLFPRENYLTSPQTYDYEGNWAFAVFDDPYFLAARFGYGSGMFDVRDYFPSASPPDPNFMHIHVEIVTEECVFQWINSLDYTAGDLG